MSATPGDRARLRGSETPWRGCQARRHDVEYNIMSGCQAPPRDAFPPSSSFQASLSRVGWGEIPNSEFRIPNSEPYPLNVMAVARHVLFERGDRSPPFIAADAAIEVGELRGAGYAVGGPVLGEEGDRDGR